MKSFRSLAVLAAVLSMASATVAAVSNCLVDAYRWGRDLTVGFVLSVLAGPTAADSEPKQASIVGFVKQPAFSICAPSSASAP